MPLRQGWWQSCHAALLTDFSNPLSPPQAACEEASTSCDVTERRVRSESPARVAGHIQEGTLVSPVPRSSGF